LISKQELADAAISLFKAFPADGQNVGNNSGVGGLANLINIAYFREIKDSGCALSIRGVVACLRQSNSTDPRDMVYGVMDLVTTSIRPYYTRATTENVYISPYYGVYSLSKSNDKGCLLYLRL
jgi:hypothetical protein